MVNGWRKRAFLYIGVTLLIVGGLAGYIILVDALNLHIECGLLRLTGLYCPACGGSRMFISIIMFDFYQAMRYNIFVFFSIPYLTSVYLYQGYSYICKNKSWRYIDNCVIGYIVAIVIFGILRNVSFLGWLAPVTL